MTSKKKTVTDASEVERLTAAVDEQARLLRLRKFELKTKVAASHLPKFVAQTKKFFGKAHLTLRFNYDCMDPGELTIQWNGNLSTLSQLQYSTRDLLALLTRTQFQFDTFVALTSQLLDLEAKNQALMAQVAKLETALGKSKKARSKDNPKLLTTAQVIDSLIS